MRENFPTDREALRIVQYDSCRGLEGWTVVNYGFDEFWDYKYRQRLALPRGTDDLFVTADEEAKEFVSRWAMIPLTRATDTLVINISDKPSPIREALEALREKRADFLEWIVL